MSTRTRFLLLNTPHNPTGKVFTLDELAVIVQICLENDLIVLVDEVYEYLTYDGNRHQTIAAIPGMRERTLVVSSAGKTFNVTGWKVGWACGPVDIITAVSSVKQYLTFAGGTAFQETVALGLYDGDEWVDALCDDLSARRDLLMNGLSAAGFRLHRVEGAYFVQADARSFGYQDGTALCRDLPRIAGVVPVSSVAFFDDKEAGCHLVRFALCKSSDLLSVAVDRLSAMGSSSVRE